MAGGSGNAYRNSSVVDRTLGHPKWLAGLVSYSEISWGILSIAARRVARGT
jgi:hypothetical protein